MPNEKQEVSDNLEMVLTKAEKEPEAEDEATRGEDSKTKDRVVGWTASGALLALGAAITKYFC